MITRASESDSDSIIDAILAAVEENPLSFLVSSNAEITRLAEKSVETMKNIPMLLTDLRKDVRAITREVFDKFLQPYFDDQNDSAFFLYKSDGVVKGLIGFSAGSSKFKQEHVGRVVWYWVKSDCRQAGIGSELLETLLGYVSTLKHIEKICTKTFTSDHTFVSEIFKRRSFHVAGIQSGMIKCAGSYSDIVTLEKLCAPSHP